jgi:hypothetical protein
MLSNRIDQHLGERAIMGTAPVRAFFRDSPWIILTGPGETAYQFSKRFDTLFLVGLTTE